MALRILSGMIFIPRGGIQQGSAEITFDPFELANASNALFELRKRREVGPRGRFVRSPASIVAARQFDIVPIANNFRVNINDTVTRDSITISWSARTARVDQEEIPFMIVGEVPDGRASVRPGPGTPVRPGDDLPSELTSRKRARARGKSRKKKRG